MSRREKNISCVIFFIFMVGFTNYTSCYPCNTVLSNSCFFLCCFFFSLVNMVWKQCFNQPNYNIVSKPSFFPSTVYRIIFSDRLSYKSIFTASVTIFHKASPVHANIYLSLFCLFFVLRHRDEKLYFGKILSMRWNLLLVKLLAVCDFKKSRICKKSFFILQIY